MTDTLTVDDVAVTPPHDLVDLAYHLGIRPDQLGVDLTVDVDRRPTGPGMLYLPDGWIC